MNVGTVSDSIAVTSWGGELGNRNSRDKALSGAAHRKCKVTLQRI